MTVVGGIDATTVVPVAVAFARRSPALPCYCNDHTARFRSPSRYRCPVAACACSRESLPPQATGPVSGAESQTTEGQRFHTVADGNSEPNDRVARCFVERQTGYTHRLASQRVPAVLALEIQADRKTAFAQRPSATYQRDGRRQCDMGRGTYC